jgi:nitroreductase
MDVFEAIESRIACRWFLDEPVDLNIVRNLIEGAARAASNGNLQPWNVHAVTGEVLKEIKRQATAALEKNDWRTMETEYPALPDNLCEPYCARNFRLGRELYGALGTSRDDRVGRDAQIKRNYQFFNAPVGLFITIDRRLGPGQWADLGGYINTLAFLARGYGLDTCPQVVWIRMYKIVGALLNFPPEQMLFCGMGIGYRDPSHPVNNFRSFRAELPRILHVSWFRMNPGNDR